MLTGGFDAAGMLHVLDISNEGVPVEVGWYSPAGWRGGLLALGGLLYSADTGAGLQILLNLGTLGHKVNLPVVLRLE